MAVGGSLVQDAASHERIGIDLGVVFPVHSLSVSDEVLSPPIKESSIAEGVHNMWDGAGQFKYSTIPYHTMDMIGV